MKIELKPNGTFMRDRLFINIGRKWIHFHPYIDGSGNYFMIKIEDLKNLLK